MKPVVYGLTDNAFSALVRMFGTYRMVFEHAHRNSNSLRRLCKRCGIDPDL
jgi:hypothetical protein